MLVAVMTGERMCNSGTLQTWRRCRAVAADLVTVEVSLLPYGWLFVFVGTAAFVDQIKDRLNRGGDVPRRK